MEELRLVDFGILNTKDLNDRSFIALSQKLRRTGKSSHHQIPIISTTASFNFILYEILGDHTAPL
jgi:hypothetical protein